MNFFLFIILNFVSWVNLSEHRRVSFTERYSLPEAPANSLSRVFRFGPEGVTFNEPVTILLTYDDAEVAGSDEGSLKVHLLVGGEYVEVPNCDPCCEPPIPPDPCVYERDTDANTITIKTTHFSLYDLSALPNDPPIIKENAIECLSDYVGESKRFKNAIKKINKSLNDKYWIDKIDDPTHLSCILTKMNRQGFIHSDGRIITLKDIRGLTELADGERRL